MDAQQIMQTLEGKCPKCGESAELYAASGTHAFFRMQAWVYKAPNISIWEELDRDTIGEVEFKCKNGHSTVIGFGRYGEWI